MIYVLYNKDKGFVNKQNDELVFDNEAALIFNAEPPFHQFTALNNKDIIQHQLKARLTVLWIYEGTP